MGLRVGSILSIKLKVDQKSVLARCHSISRWNGPKILSRAKPLIQLILSQMLFSNTDEK